MKRKGFWLAGSFIQGQKAKYMATDVKPFIIDDMEGTVVGKVLSVITNTNKHKSFEVNEWCFYEGKKLSDIDKEIWLKESINDVWEYWCGKHKRKYSPIIEVNNNERLPKTL